MYPDELGVVIAHFHSLSFGWFICFNQYLKHVTWTTLCLWFWQYENKQILVTEKSQFIMIWMQKTCKINIVFKGTLHLYDMKEIVILYPLQGTSYVEIILLNLSICWTLSNPISTLIQTKACAQLLNSSIFFLWLHCEKQYLSNILCSNTNNICQILPLV